MNVLLSIKPEFAEKILANEKQYEFRKTGFRDDSAIDTVIMYASSPVQRIVGTFTVGDVIETGPETLWTRFGDKSGIDDKDRFLDYFTGKKTGYAIEIDEVYPLSSPMDPRQHLDEFRPPVSFKYICGELEALLNNRVLQAP